MDLSLQQWGDKSLSAFDVFFQQWNHQFLRLQSFLEEALCCDGELKEYDSVFYVRYYNILEAAGGKIRLEVATYQNDLLLSRK